MKHGHAGDATNKPRHQSIRQAQAENSSLPSLSHTTDAADLCNLPAGTRRPIIAWLANCMSAEIGVLPKWLFLASLAAIVRSAALLLHPLCQRLLSISVAVQLAAALQLYACL